MHMGKVSFKNFNNSGSNLIRIAVSIFLIVGLTSNPESPMEENEATVIDEKRAKVKTGKELAREAKEEEMTVEPVEQMVLNEVKESPSVGTGKFVWPAQGGYISSKKGQRWGEEHKGIDIAQPDGFDIVAADHGVVKAAGTDGTFGKRVIIDHKNGYETIYAHLDSIDVKVGDKVAQDKKIGVMGTTGRSTGVHLHFEISYNGVIKDPLTFISQ